MQSPAPIIILHLSDLHFGNEGSDQAKSDAKQAVLKSLLECIAALPPEWKPNMVCISGDIAWSATEDQYKDAEAWVRKLLSQLALTSEDLIVCPGNHDIERSLAASPPKEHEEADKLFLLPIAETDSLHQPFTEYSAFCSRLGIPKYLCGDVESYLVGIRRHRGLVFASYNSAWFAKGGDLGRLWMGLPLLRHMEAKNQLPKLQAMGSDTVIALMHHPFDWLHDAEKHQRDLRKCTTEFLCYRTSLLLTGHTHDTAKEPTLLNNRCWHFPAGATYDHDRHFNAFRLIRISPPQIDQISYEYDPRSPDDGWIRKGDPASLPLSFRPEYWSVIASHTDLFIAQDSRPADQVTANAGLSYSKAIDTDAVSIADNDNEKEIDLEIKRTVELVNQGHTKQGQGELSQLYVRAEALAVSKTLLARIANNWGLCLLENDAIEEAAEKFRLATEHDPTNALMFANLAEARLRQGNVGAAKGAIEKARELKGNDVHVLNVYGDYLVKSAQRDLFPALFTELSTVHDESVEWQVVIAQLHFDAGHVSDAKLLLRQIPQPGQERKEVKELLARVLIEDVRTQVHQNMELAKDLPIALRTQIKEAQQLLDDLIIECKDHDGKRMMAALHVNRGATRALLEQWEDALRDYDKVLAEEPENKHVIKARLMALIGAKRFDEAMGIVSQQTDPLLSFALAQSLLDAGLNDPAIKVLETLNVSDTDDTLQKLQLLMMGWKRLSKPQEVASIIKVLETNFPSNANALCQRAEYAHDQGDTETAIRLLEQAVGSAQDAKWKNFATLNLANLLLTEGKGEEAVKVLESAEYGKDDALLRKYAAAMYFAGRADTALQIIETNLIQWKNDAEILGIFVEILESIGDFARAIEFAKILVSLAPAHIGYKLILGRLQPAMGQYEDARKILDTIDIEIALARAEFIVPLAFQYRCLGLVDRAIELMLRAREKHFSNPDVHQAFISIFLSLPAEHLARQTLEAVAVDTVVTFTQDGTKHSYLITEGKDADLRRSELSADSHMAKVLLGKKPGDEVIVKDQGLEKSSVRVDSILTKYGYALAETLNKYSTWFPERMDLQKGDISQIEAIAQEIGKRRNRLDMILSFYRKNQMPVGMMAKLLGTTLPQVWLDVINSPGMNFRISFGSLDDLNPQREAVSTCQTVILDTTAVLTVALLGIEESVRVAFKKLLVAGSVLGELESAIQQEAIDAKSQLPAHMPEAAKVQDRLTLLRRAQEFALSLEVHASPELLSESSDKERNIYGKTGTASFILAKREQAAIYSDDVAFRIVIRNEHGIKGFCTQTLLLRLTALHIITADQYTVLIAKLMAHRYWYILVNAFDFLRMFKDKQIVTDSFKALASGLTKPCDLDRLVDVVIEFMQHLWLGGVPFSTSDLFLREMLNPICSSYSTSIVERTMTAALREKFGHMPTFYGVLIYTVKTLLKQSESRQNH